ncbi:MAG: helix-turn-helix transcriptional regulator [Bdellovibrio sp.]|nr:helix-turn-helix transcriptional regulator [Bdellovibrio sp.]
MATSATLIETLKNNLKARGITYKKLAIKWGLSEASVKRLMSDGDLSLSRIETACELMSISFSELIKLTPFEVEIVDQLLKPEHEEEFAQELRLYHFWTLLLEGQTVRQIEKKYVVSVNDVQKFLLQLDRMKLIELHPKNRVKILEQNRRLLRKDGPMGKVLLQQAKTSFLEHPFKNSLLEHLRFTMYKLSPQSAIRYKTKIDKMITEMKNESQIEAELPESIEFGLLAALRPWQSPLLEALPLKG